MMERVPTNYLLALILERVSNTRRNAAWVPSERYYQQRGRKPKKLTDWARHMAFQLRRWLPQAWLVLVADSAYTALEFRHACQTVTVTVITRLRLEVQLIH